jgi:hypothetical protein
MLELTDSSESGGCRRAAEDVRVFNAGDFELAVLHGA